MRNYLSALLLLVSSFVSSSELPSFESSNTPIAEFVSWFSGQSGQTIILGRDVVGDVSFSVTDLKSSEYGAFFDAVLSAHGYELVKKNGVYTVVIASVKVEANVQPSLVKLYRLDNVRNTRIVDLMNAMLAATAEGSSEKQVNKSYGVQVLPTTNGIIVTGSKNQLAKIDMIIQGIDRPQKQVFIEAIITEIEMGDSQEIGVNMSTALNKAGFVTNPLNSINQGADNLLMFDDGNFSAFIKAVENNENTKLLSKPKMLVLDREKGYITVGQNVPFLVSTETTDGGNRIQQIERQDVGVSLAVVPHVIGDNVVLDIRQESSSVSNSVIASDIITNRRTLQTVVHMRSGQTLVLGGLVSSQDRKSEGGVPVLRSIPLLGALFRYERIEEVQTELRVVIKLVVI